MKSREEKKRITVGQQSQHGGHRREPPQPTQRRGVAPPPSGHQHQEKRQNSPRQEEPVNRRSRATWLGDQCRENPRGQPTGERRAQHKDEIRGQLMFFSPSRIWIARGFQFSFPIAHVTGCSAMHSGATGVSDPAQSQDRGFQTGDITHVEGLGGLVDPAQESAEGRTGAQFDEPSESLGEQITHAGLPTH